MRQSCRMDATYSGLEDGIETLVYGNMFLLS